MRDKKFLIFQLGIFSICIFLFLLSSGKIHLNFNVSAQYNNPPTCSISGPSTVVLGDPLPSYTSFGSDPEPPSGPGDLNKIEGWWSPSWTQSWTNICTNSFSPTSSGNCSGTANFGQTGTFYVVCNAYDSGGKKCSGSPWLPLPPGWNDCGANDLITVSVVTPSPTPTNTPTPTATPTPTFYQVYGWVYTEKNTYDLANRASENSEGLISGYSVHLFDHPADPTPTTLLNSYISSSSPVGGVTGNYIFSPLASGVYTVGLTVIPTGSVLYPGFTNPQVNIHFAGYDAIADFPFVTITVTPAPSLVPTVTPTSTPPPTDITPTSVLPITPSPCLPLPTPNLQGPDHDICTNTKPTFSANVSDPNKDNVWARFYSNAFETFRRMGTVQYPNPGTSVWAPDGSVLNTNGSYWWSAYTESSSCPRSSNAPARLLNMDYAAPPIPQIPSCTFVSQDLVSGNCTFTCSWPADPEPTGVSCSDTSSYFSSFRTSPSGGWEPGWGSDLSKAVVTNDGQILYAKVKAKDGVGNESPYSDEGGPYTCPKINFSSSPTPGGAPTLTPTPSNTPTPTITPTPTPGSWVEIAGGDVYFKCTDQPVPPSGNMIIPLPGNPNSGGISWTNKGCGMYGLGPTPILRVFDNLTNANSFSYYWDGLSKYKSVNIDKEIVGDPADLTTVDDCSKNVYSYSGRGYYRLYSPFSSALKSKVTVFLISGSLDITSDFTVPADKSVVFIVNGNIHIAANIRNIGGLFISSQTFSIASGSPGTLTINGMIYANKLDTGTFKSFSSPVYKVIYEPKYAVSLLSCMGRPQVNWQEVKP